MSLWRNFCGGGGGGGDDGGGGGGVDGEILDKKS